MKLADLALHNNIKYHDELDPKLWENEKLKKEVRSKLLEIGEAFLEFLEIDENALQDYLLVGSAANYNWSQFSDIDLHVVLDYDIVGQSCNMDIVEEFLFAKRGVWKLKQKITIMGMPVEVGPQDKNAELESSGAFSLLENDWIKKPAHKEPKVDEHEYEAKVLDMKKKIDRILSGKYTSEEADKVREEIKDMRQRGLKKGGEFNPDNLAFKSLRNQGYIDKLENYKVKAVDKELSLGR
jgi:hypothetical protein